MSNVTRVVLLCVACLVLAPAAWHAGLALPPFGAPTSAYGQTVNTLAPKLRNVSNMVAAVNFDIRGFDTLGEEIMLLCAVTGTVILLRGARGEKPTDRAGRLSGRGTTERTDAMTLVCRIGAFVVVLFGIYVVLHGTVTPGGGFQGGVVTASGLLLLYLGDGYASWRGLVQGKIMALLEGSGALLFVAAAASSLAFGHPALDNLLPLGHFKQLDSGGMMVVVNAAVGLSVMGSFALLLLEFMEETRSPEDDPVPDEEDR